MVKKFKCSLFICPHTKGTSKPLNGNGSYFFQQNLSSLKQPSCDVQLSSDEERQNTFCILVKIMMIMDSPLESVLRMIIRTNINKRVHVYMCVNTCNTFFQVEIKYKLSLHSNRCLTRDFLYILQQNNNNTVSR